MIQLRTGILDRPELDAEIEAIIGDLRAGGVNSVAVSFGFGCDPEASIGWDEVISVTLSDLARFLAEGEAAGLFELGRSNLTLAGGGLEFLLCHERDVHCSGSESAHLRAVQQRWMATHTTIDQWSGTGPSWQGNGSWQLLAVGRRFCEDERPVQANPSQLSGYAPPTE